MKKIKFISVTVLFALCANAQVKNVIVPDSAKTFYDIKKEYEDFWKGKEVSQEEDEREGGGYEIFKRWASYMEPRVYPSGNLKTAGAKRSYEEFQKYLNSNSTAKQIITATPSSTTANWTALGPFGSALGSGAGRCQCIRFHPSGTGTVYIGAVDGGLWTSTNNGVSWTTTTDQIGSLGVSDIVINPISPNIMYISTGDFDGAPTGFSGGDSKSIGVLKSIDGGLTWAATGLAWTTSQSRFISKLLINPLNPVEVFAFTTAGIYRTRNSGTTWSLVTPGYYKDAEYKPGDTTTIYAANGSSVYRSINGGQSFTNIYNSSFKQIRIAVTAADANYLYVAGTDAADAFGGLARSTNSGATFTVMSTTPNILGGNQGWYDLDVASSPANRDEVIVGGIDLWKSTNGGATWTQLTAAYTFGPPYIHPDQHNVVYMNGTNIWAANDGGIYRTTNSGGAWSDVNGNMNISEPYFLGVSALSSTRIIAGLQDNGTILYNGSSWTLVKGGDGMACFVDWNNNNTLVGSYVNGAHAKSTNSGATWSNIVTGLTGTGNWIAPIIQDPTNPNIFYAGRQDVFKSTNQGGSWSQAGALGGSGDVMVISAAPSNSNIIYAARATSLFKTTNGGTTWTDITAGLPVSFAQITDIDIDNTNANNVYVTFSGYSAGNKVFYTTDGGLSWTNYSTGLPNLPANCVVFTKNSPGAIYVGMDFGVYYRELSMSSFVPYNTGLPNVWVNDMGIYYPTGKLRAATFGRGMYETDLYSQPGVVPNAFFITTSNTICVGSSVSFNDASSNSPTSWAWSFPGGSLPSSTVKNPPSITYSATGTYTVSLVATNSVGASSPYTSTVYVINTPTSVSTSTGTCAGQMHNLLVTTNASNVIWQGGQTGTSASFGPTVTTVYSYTVFSGACSSTGTATMSVGPPPATPSFTQLGNILTSTSAPGYQWYFNGGPIPGATTQTVDISVLGAGFYSVWVDNGMGCQVSSTVVFLTPTNINHLSNFEGVTISPNPAYEVLNIAFKTILDKDVSFTIINALGQTIKTGKIRSGTSEKTSVPLDGLANGLYTLSLYSASSSVSYKFLKQ
ncbi:MAG TPA: PKD domain-containing protein [Bacteroidia bacterium]|jgi:PKD repeat protein|nr:PKD domain-containing protein [Bacteroidia bacterium]